MRILKSQCLFVAAIALLCIPSPVNADTVKILEGTVIPNHALQLNNFYNNNSVISSVINGSIVGQLAGIDLFISYLPDDLFTGAEIGEMTNHLAGGGRIMFLGEHPGFFLWNDRINATLGTLGSGMSLGSTGFIDTGFHLATVENGQILPHPLTAGINTFTYAFPAEVIGAAVGNELFQSVNSAYTFIAVESFGGGSIVLSGDSNIIEAVSPGSATQPNPGNDTFFLNASNVVRAPVPEPSTSLLLGLGIGLMGLVSYRQRKEDT